MTVPQDDQLDPALVAKMNEGQGLLDQLRNTVEGLEAPPPASDAAEIIFDQPEEFLPHAEPMGPAPTGHSPQRERRNAWAAQGKADRQMRLGRVDPPDPELPGGTNRGAKAPGSDSIRGAQDVNGAQVIYQEQLTATLTTMAKVLMDATVKLEALEAYFDRLR